MTKTPAELRTSFLRRFGPRPTYVYNPLGGELLVWEEIAYSTSGNVPGRSDLYLGQDFYRFTGIEYAFEKIPQTVELDDWGSTKRHHAVYRLPHKSPPTILGEGLSALEEEPGDASRLVTYALAHAVAGNEDPKFLDLLDALCENQDITAKCAEVLERAETRVAEGNPDD